MKIVLMILLVLLLFCKVGLLNTKVRYFSDDRTKDVFIKELKVKKYEYWVTPLDKGVYEVDYIEKASKKE